MDRAPDRATYRGTRDVIVAGASAGGVGAVRRLLAGLSADLPAAVLVVIHRGDSGPSLLPEVLGAVSPLPVRGAVEGQRLERGTVYVPPVDRHLLLAGDHLHVRRGPHENRTRPAIDPLFRSAAATCSTRVIGVVLSGMLDDGTSGLIAIKRCGGITVVQDPRDALYPDMPRSALRHAPIDHVVSVSAMPALLAGLAAGPRPPEMEPPEDVRLEAMIAALEVGDSAGKLGRPSLLTCPECHGVVAEIEEEGLIRFRCHTGHAFTAEALQEAQADAWERAVYDALRTQEEQTLLARRIAAEARRSGNLRAADEMERRAAGYQEGADTLRRLLAAASRENAP